ncbi:MAG: glycosyltransferase family 2 protein [Elusimicrobia bacterium]|nr:glycosyltransferase family 2 protein [Elusimicrobiota bacterium]
MTRVCVLIPAYNEESAIGRVVEDLIRHGMDVLVVDDGSSDRTAEMGMRAGAKVLKNVKNNGKGYSLQRGFDYVISQGYEAVLTMDGDGQHAVEDVDAFLEVLRKGEADIVCGNRMRNPKGMPGVRFVTNKIMSGLISLVCRQKIYDTQCGFRLVRTEVLKNIQISSSAFEIESEVLIKACKKGFRVRSVPIRTIYSTERSKINPFFDTVRFIVYIVREMFVR